MQKNNAKINDYTNNLTAIGCDMAVTNYTRFSENCKPLLLDNIYTNLTKQDTYSGDALHELSDHLPTFLLQKIQNVL